MRQNNSGIQLNSLFTGNNNQPQNDEKPRAQYWLNVGLPTGVETENGTMSFLSLPVGIPLDNMERCRVPSKDGDFKQFQSARNNLYDAIMEKAASLKPGEELFLDLQVQLRRTDSETTEIPANENKFLVNIKL